MHEGFTFYSSKLRGFRDWEHRVRWKYLSRRHKSSLDFGENAKARRQDCLRLSGLLEEETLLEIADKDFRNEVVKRDQYFPEVLVITLC